MKQRKILLVVENIDYYSTMLSIAGYEVKSCKNLEDLFRLLDSTNPDLIFWAYTDSNTDRTRNYLSSIHQLRVGKKRAIIVLATAMTDVPITIGDLVDYIVHEPLSVPELVNLMKKLLSNGASHRSINQCC